MNRLLPAKILAGLCALAISLSACTKEGGEEPPAQTPGGDGDTTPDTRALYKDLGVSGIYRLDIPFHVIDSRYVPANREDQDPEPPIEARENLSAQACQIRNALHGAVGDVTDNLELFCSLDKIEGLKVGVKYHIALTTEDQRIPPSLNYTIQLWADDAKLAAEGYVTVYKCENKELTNVVRLKTQGAGRTLAASYDIRTSRYELQGKQIQSTHHSHTRYDLGYTEPGLSKLAMGHNSLRLEEEQKSDQFSRTLFLELRDSGVSKVATVEAMDRNVGQPDRKTSIKRFVGLFSPDLATSIEQTAFEASTNSFTTIQDYFDGSHTIVPKASRPEFGEGGSHELTGAALPKGHPYDLLPPSFPQGSWDCKGTEQQIQHTISNAERKICSISYGYPRICQTPTRVTTNQDTLVHDGTGLVDHSVFEQQIPAIGQLNRPGAAP